MVKGVLCKSSLVNSSSSSICEANSASSASSFECDGFSSGRWSRSVSSAVGAAGSNFAICSLIALVDGAMGVCVGAAVSAGPSILVTGSLSWVKSILITMGSSGAALTFFTLGFTAAEATCGMVCCCAHALSTKMLLKMPINFIQWRWLKVIKVSK